MWMCPTCGEAHDDRFKECWKCAGAEMDQASLPALLTPKQDRKLRSFHSILVRAAMAFVPGALLGAAIASRTLPSEPSEVVQAGLILGLVFAGAIGLFIWVFYPYEAGAAARDQPGEKGPAD